MAAILSRGSWVQQCIGSYQQAFVIIILILGISHNKYCIISTKYINIARGSVSKNNSHSCVKICSVLVPVLPVFTWIIYLYSSGLFH